jgi:hypothetical protein
MENPKVTNPREFWLDTVRAAIGTLSDEELRRGADAISVLGAKFVLELEHTKTVGNTFHFRPRAYVDVLAEHEEKEIRIDYIN